MPSFDGGKALCRTALFTPLRLGRVTLKHRVVMAPCGRLRASQLSEGIWTTNDVTAKYYGQRASKGGLIITESTPISRTAAGYPGIAGIFTKEQVVKWRKVTQKVHDKGGFIFCQIWHAGRATIPEYLGGAIPLSSSSLSLPGKFIGPGPKEYDSPPPKEMTKTDIANVIKNFVDAAKRSIEEGFDGVEIHGANGYLLEQFLHDNVNNRQDEYGGTIENRCRFPMEVIKAVATAIGGDRTGIRLSPFNYWHGTHDSDPMLHWSHLCEEIIALPVELRPAYVNSIEPRFDELLSEEAKIKSLSKATLPNSNGGDMKQDSTPSLTPFRRILAKGGVRFFVAGNYDRESAAPAVDGDLADGVIFGRYFIANPDLPYRLAEGLPLNKWDRSTFYGADAPSKGYTDYPFWRDDKPHISEIKAVP
ncbi:12-oxophytodienoate reductase [Cadophora sp. DSE1049]|nr:12-oxophytodienoate reductase [Cadophora sp. DSE1049]